MYVGQLGVGSVLMLSMVSKASKITPWMLVPANTGFHNEGIISNCRCFAELAGHAKIASLHTN
jgi:hypothetical protein